MAEDYQANTKDTQLLFAEVQNKLFYAVTGKTAAELIVARADATQPNMNLTSFSGSRVRKADVVIAKNYLHQNELEQLNRLVTMFFDFAEFRAKNKEHLRLDDWRAFVDKFLDFNEQPLLSGAGQLSRGDMELIAHQRYDEFDGNRKRQEALEADHQEMEELKQLEARLKKQHSGTDKKR